MTAEHALDAYERLAPAYDALTAHHDHTRWAELLEARARAAGLDGRRLLDVGCGTGNMLAPMVARGYAATGVDISPGMVAEARRKLPADVELVVADMRVLPTIGEHDLVWCVGDALNYLDDEDDLAAAFDGFRRNLAPGGVVVFDVNTLGTFRRLYSSMLVVPAAERVIVLEGRGSVALASGGTAIAWIDRLEPDDAGWWKRERSVHRHRHHPQQTVRRALARGALDCHAVHGCSIDGPLDAPLDELRHSKAVYIARQAAPDTA